MIAVIERLLFVTLAVTLSTSFVIGLLLVLSALLRKRYSARWLYAAWLVVAVRLLIPANIPLPAMPVSIPVPEQIFLRETTDPEPSAQPEELPPGGTKASTRQTDRRPVPVVRILAAVWVAGAMCFLAVQVTGSARFRRRLRCHRMEPAPEHILGLLEQAGADMKLAALPRIGINSGVSTPLLMGLLRPMLLLPHADFSDHELAFILRHELVHYRRCDLWYKLVLLVVHAAHWFNPLVGLMVRDAGKQMEMSCDDAVMAGLDSSLRADYCEVILNTLPVRGGPAMTTSFGNLKGNTKMRIDNLFDKTRKRRGIASLCSVVLITAVIGGLVSYAPVSAAAEPLQTANGGQAPAAPVVSDPRLTLVEREFTTSELRNMNISGIEVVVPTENVSITRGGDTLKFSYYQQSDSEYDFTTVLDGGGTRTYWALLRMTEGRSNDPQRTIHVSLPENYTPKTIFIRTTSGDIAVSGCTVDGMGIFTSSQSGNITLDDCAANFFKAITNTGDIALRNQLTDTGMIISDTGTVLFQPRDSVSSYHFDFFTRPTNTITVNGQSYAGGEFELNQSASKTIWVESGYVELTDKEDIPGEGTATFTIRD